jgi:hypothetical protein
MKAPTAILAVAALAWAGTATAAPKANDLLRSILGRLPQMPAIALPAPVKVVDPNELIRGALEKIAKSFERVCTKTHGALGSGICNDGPASP